MNYEPRIDRSTERRGSRRFPIERELSYRTLDHRTVTQSGTGKTIDISSSGVLFATQERLRFGKRVELSVSWPAVLDGGCLLKFVATGRVVRVQDGRAALRIDQYEFRTRRSKDYAIAASDSLTETAVYH